jgi:hypothetical protein
LIAQQSKRVTIAERRFMVAAAKVAMATSGIAQAMRVEPASDVSNRTAGQSMPHCPSVGKTVLILLVIVISNQNKRMCGAGPSPSLRRRSD